MKALTWKNPYAWLMLHGKVETRPWDTNYRGEVLICAGLSTYNLESVVDISGYYQTGRIVSLMVQTDPRFRVSGRAIAVGELVDSRLMFPSDQDKTFVNFDSRLYCHIYRNVRPIQPFPFKGSQRWKNVDQDTIEQIEYL